MSYEFAAALQAAVYGRLAGDLAVAALVGEAIHDGPLERGAEPAAADYVTLGEEEARAFGSKTSRGAVHDFTVAVHSGRDGFDRAKRIAGAVCACLIDAPLELAAGRLVGLRFLRARAERGPAPEKRRVALRFRAVLDQDD
ncbi:DUF3168 domain-containing protein [Amaricoccus sp.]|uniref:DUF3168 domain-containing protein n=1 Tax=Amaricoccus sp. TaxID=1872485 RepID=UPI001B3F5774|nr:DUF3168 domain-containing protein [Amaricoccus sp.]MBP7002252.1 DUF3168 domain-containing protein [Amaricoccus sp.]